ncbi:MAG TPA: exo-alpha-sialidase [Candidatus Dormibacteraeota bacterium]|jgi:photosystem II stability/assembly factor-like uncharacterized protein|nr:exo-alpha-sialidase [Candidatus Dormibacteraeota bacterium]
MKKGVVVMVGTRKGAYLLRSNGERDKWSEEGPLFPGEPVYHLSFDPRDGESLFAACNQTWGGPKVQVSRDLGKTWTVASNPAFPKGHRNTFRRTWHIEPGHGKTPNVMWAGVAPAGLFKSSDRGMTWEPVLSLIDHPTSDQWQPGGAGETALHSIGVDAGDPNRIVIAISAGGAYITTDGGASWRPWNEGTRAEFQPNPEPEVGQCVHHLVSHPAKGGVFFQRNHNRVYFRNADEQRWIDRQEGLPTNFGFAGAIDPHDPDTAYVIPLDERVRLAPKDGIAVWRTTDRGKTWKRLDKGLPEGAQAEVMREGMATDRRDPVGIYFGTVNGEVWASADGGKRFERIAAYLPPILSVSTATLE